MGEQKQHLYHNFSRKDLQGLCKKYGLPANKSNSEMATSLILYLEKKNLNSRPIWEATKSDPFPLELPAGTRISPTGDPRKDFRGTMSRRGSGNDQFYRAVQQNHLDNCKDPATSDKVHKDSNGGAGLPENTISYVVRPAVQAPSPSFQFDVTSENGIQLYVDLNSSPSDWVESLKDGVHICQDTNKLESPSFHHELGWLYCSKQMKGSSLVDSYKEMNDGDVKEESYAMGGGSQAQTNEPHGGEVSLSSPGRNPSDTVHELENLGEEQTTTSSKPESDIEKQVCGAQSCKITQIRTCDNSSGNSLPSDPKCSRKLVNEGLNVGNDIHKKPSLQPIYGAPDRVLICKGSASSFVEIRASPGDALGQDRVSMCLDFAHQSQGAHTEYASCSAWMNSHSSDPTDLKHQKVEAKHGKASTSSKSSKQILEAPKHLASSHRQSTSLSPYQNYNSRGVVNLTNSIETKNGGILRPHGVGQEAVEMNSSLVVVQRKDASLSSCSNGSSLHLVVPKQNGAGHCIPADSNELDEDILKSQPTTSVENLGRINAGDRRKSSECLDFRDSMEETWRKHTDSEPNRGLKRKRQVNNSGDQSESVKRDAKILRTSKQFAEDVHTSRRRSSRLFTK